MQPTNTLSPLEIVLTSVVTASFISGFFLVINSWLQRKSDREKLLISSAVELTKMEDERKGELIKVDMIRIASSWDETSKTFLKIYDELNKLSTNHSNNGPIFFLNNFFKFLKKLLTING